MGVFDPLILFRRIVTAWLPYFKFVFEFELRLRISFLWFFCSSTEKNVSFGSVIYLGMLSFWTVIIGVMPEITVRGTLTRTTTLRLGTLLQTYSSKFKALNFLMKCLLLRVSTAVEPVRISKRA